MLTKHFQKSKTFADKHLIGIKKNIHIILVCTCFIEFVLKKPLF